MPELPCSPTCEYPGCMCIRGRGCVQVGISAGLAEEWLRFCFANWRRQKP